MCCFICFCLCPNNKYEIVDAVIIYSIGCHLLDNIIFATNLYTYTTTTTSLVIVALPLNRIFCKLDFVREDTFSHDRRVFKMNPLCSLYYLSPPELGWMDAMGR
jgi:hypothetical protein